MSSALSQVKIESFRERLSEDRDKAAVTQALFERAASYREYRDVVRRELAFGIDGVLRTEPFQDRSNWAEYRTWEFAVAQEKFVLGRVADLLIDTPRALESPLDWESMSPRLGALVASSNANVVFLTGDVPLELVTAIRMDDRSWQAKGPTWRNTLRSTVWMIGDILSVPILQIPSVKAPLSAFAVNLNRWATYNRFCPVDAGELFRVSITTHERGALLSIREAFELQVREPGAVARMDLLGIRGGLE